MKFYQKNWFIWLSLIFFAPLGIILLWTQKKYKPFPRVILSIIFLIFFIIVLPKGEVNETDTANRSEPNVEITKEGKMALDNKNIDLLFSNPKEYKGANIEFTGRVFVKPERDKNSVYLQVFSDPKNSEGNIMVIYNEPNFPVDIDTYVKISGSVKGELKGTNVFGATLNIPMVEAHSIEIVDYITAVSPPLEVINVNDEINQHGIILTLNKVEFAEDETRAYLKVKNESNVTVHIWTHSAKIIQNNKQFEIEYNFQADYPKLQSDILSGVESEGIIVFPALDINQPLRFIIEGSCSDYSIKINPFEFNVNQQVNEHT